MKKLLTVVLCVAVIFTFSFSGAFAASTSNYSDTLGNKYLDSALKAVDKGDATLWVSDTTASKSAIATDGYEISYDVLKANLDKLQEAAKDYYDQSGSYFNKDNYDDANVDLGALLTNAGVDADLKVDLAQAQFTEDQNEALSILDSVSFSGVSTKEMDDDCAHAVACETYKAHVQKLVSDARSYVNDLENNSNTTVATFAANKAKIDALIGKVGDSRSYTSGQDNWTEAATAADVVKMLVIQKAYNDGTNWVGLDSYELNEDWQEVSNATVEDTDEFPTVANIYYSQGQKWDDGQKKYVAANTNAYYDDSTNTGKTISDFLTSNKDADDATTDATIAALKAKVAEAKAKYVKKNDSTSDKEYADNIQEALNYLIDEKVLKDEASLKLANLYAVDSTTGKSTVDADTIANAKEAVKYAKQLKDEVATLAAETDANGTLVRDADDVDKALTDGLKAIYALAMSNSDEKEDIVDEYKDALSDVQGLYVSLDDTKLAYYKQNAVSLINKFYDDNADDYYAPELADLRAYADKAIAAVQAATKHSEVTKAMETWEKDKDVDTKTEVYTKNSSAIDGLIDDAADYAEALNSKMSKKDNQYVTGAKAGALEYGASATTADNTKLAKLIKDLVGEKDARTTKAINDLNSEAIDLVKTLSTKGVVDDAKEALEDAYDAIPKTVKVADATTIDAACAAYDAYNDLTEDTYKQSDISAKVVALSYATNNQLDDKYDALDKNDKAALDALQDEIDAFLDKYEDYTVAATSKTSRETLETAFAELEADITKDLNKIRDNDIDDVKAAINKIPAKANITEADKAVVKAARDAYDAYVAKWTSYEDTDFTWTKAYDENGGFAADDLDSYYKTLTAAEALVGLNATTPEELVKALKITAKSVAKKGSITVTWKVVGDESVADGYQVWKSTKHSKGYKKAFTTAKKSYKNTKGLKKGTRYYYKVRAYKVVDGKNVYSDWSNKARRIAK